MGSCYDIIQRDEPKEILNRQLMLVLSTSLFMCFGIKSYIEYICEADPLKNGDG